MKLIWLVVNILQAVLTGLWSAGCITAALVARVLSGGTRVPLAMARRLWAPVLIRGAGAQVEVIDLDRVDFSQAHLFAVNHQSIIDIPVLFRVLPVNLRFILKEELRRVPFLGWYTAAMGMIFVDRRERLRSLGHMRQVAELLRDGDSIVYFPEGTRSRDGRIHRFKTGGFLPAIEAGAPVVPVAIVGTGRVLPAGGFRVRPGVVRVAVGEPIPTRDVGPEDRRELADRVRERVMALHASSTADCPPPSEED